MKKIYIRVRPADIVKTAVYSLMAVFLICTVSSVLPAMKYTGALPDLILGAAVALAYFEGERVASVFGMAAGFALEAVGSVGFSVLPLFYMLCGACASFLFVRALQRNFGAYMLYMALFMLVRSVISVIYIQLEMPDYSIATAISNVLLDEYALTVLSAIPIFFTVKLLHKLQKLGDSAEVKM